jgi:F-type H+-transporting ATPase subunit b
MLSLLVQTGHEQAAHASEGGLNPFDPAGLGGMLWTWVIFLVGLPLMWKIVMGPIARALEGRDEQAARAITEAEKARDETARARAEVQTALATAQVEAAKLLSEARGRAGTVEKQLVDEAQAKARKVVEDAQKAIVAERDKALVAIREEVVELSLAGARVVLQRNVGGDDDRRLVAEMVKELEAGKKLEATPR